MLTLDQIAAADDCPPPVKVSCPEWGGDVYVRMMPAWLRDKLERHIARMPEGEYDSRWRSLWVAFAACDETGKVKAFADPIDAAEKLREKSPAVIQRLYREVARINFLLYDSIEELSKNSDASPASSES